MIKAIFLFLKFKLHLNLDILLIFFLVPLVLLMFLRLLYYTYKDLNTKSTDLYQYKITNFFYTIAIMVLYTLLFIFILYGLRIMNINKTLDLKVLYKSLYDIYKDFILIPFIFQIYYIFILVLFLLLCLFTLAIIQILCYNEFFKFHLFLFGLDLETFQLWGRFRYIDIITSRGFRYKYTDIIDKLGSISCGFTDIFSGYLSRLCFNLMFHVKSNNILTKKVSIGEIILYYIFGKNNYRFIRHKEKYIINNMKDIVYYTLRSKYYKWLFYLSPFLFIIYDCYYNNWVLTHIYYFMLIYGPLIMIKRITDCTFSLDIDVLKIFKSIYYNKDKCIIMIPKRWKTVIINHYLLTGLKTNMDFLLNQEHDNKLTFIKEHHQFLPENTPNRFNTYTDNNGITVIKTEDNIFRELEYEHDYGVYDLGEEWIILEDKYNIEKPWVNPEYKNEDYLDMEEIKQIFQEHTEKYGSWEYNPKEER